MSVDAYLERIGIAERPTPDLDGLTALMKAHLSTVPFENIDVFRQSGDRTNGYADYSTVIPSTMT